MTPPKSWNFSRSRRVIVVEMYRRFVVVIGLALCGVLAGCTTGSAGHSATIRVMTAPSKWTAEFTVAHAGTYAYELTYAPHCVPIPGFSLIGPGGVKSFVRGPDLYAEPARLIPAHETGSVRLKAGKWKGVSGNGDPTGSQISPPVPSARLPVGGYWAAGCSWSLTLAPSH
jgi:hypothetical protein